jgi:hypothetical protein
VAEFSFARLFWHGLQGLTPTALVILATVSPSPFLSPQFLRVALRLITPQLLQKKPSSVLVKMQSIVKRYQG